MAVNEGEVLTRWVSVRNWVLNSTSLDPTHPLVVNAEHLADTLDRTSVVGVHDV